MRKQWYVIYTEWGREIRRVFGNDEEAARKFASVTENAVVYYCIII